jgi:AcrR family transcriptional regulator
MGANCSSQQRRDAIAAVLRAAAAAPSGRLPFAQLPLVTAAFSSRAQLLLALQQEWSQALRAALYVALHDRPEVDDADRRAAARMAWRTCARAHPTLRSLLDVHLWQCGPALEAALDDQDALLAAAGMRRHDSEQLVTRQVA